VDQDRRELDSRLSLDGVDRKLIAQLRLDGRQSLANLGNLIGLSGESVKDRLDRLTSLGIIKVTCSVDPKVIGFSSITLVGVKVTAAAEPIAEELATVAEFDFVACTAGEFDILVEVVCRNDQHLLEVIDSKLRSRGDVAGIVSFSYLDVLKFQPGSSGLFRSSSPAKSIELDDVDHDIVSALQADGRLSFQDLAEAIGVPYQTARRRAKYLLENNIVRTEVLVNRLVEGTAVIAGVNLRTSGPIPAIAEQLAQLEEVEIAVLTTGSFDLMLEVACRDRQHLATLVGQVLPGIYGVVSTETNIYLRVVKLPQSWDGLVRKL
jgi:Lrp/AsnC family transcriptional regulator for asnA, asnC and gidA